MKSGQIGQISNHDEIGYYSIRNKLTITKDDCDTILVRIRAPKWHIDMFDLVIFLTLASVTHSLGVPC
jgi:hypothetical protein